MNALKYEFKLVQQALASPYTYALSLAGLGLSRQVFAGGAAVTVTVALLAVLLAVQTVVDLKTRQLPHFINGMIAILGLALAALNHQNIAMALASGVGLGALFLIMGLVTSHYVGKPALGGGDIYLAGALGTCIGFTGIPPFLLGVAVLGMAVVAVRHVRSHTPEFPFGPILALSGWLTLLYQGIYWKCISSLMV